MGIQMLESKDGNSFVIDDLFAIGTSFTKTGFHLLRAGFSSPEMGFLSLDWISRCRFFFKEVRAEMSQTSVIMTPCIQVCLLRRRRSYVLD